MPVAGKALGPFERSERPIQDAAGWIGIDGGREEIGVSNGQALGAELDRRERARSVGHDVRLQLMEDFLDGARVACGSGHPHEVGAEQGLAVEGVKRSKPMPGITEYGKAAVEIAFRFVQQRIRPIHEVAPVSGETLPQELLRLIEMVSRPIEIALVERDVRLDGVAPGDRGDIARVPTDRDSAECLRRRFVETSLAKASEAASPQ